MPLMPAPQSRPEPLASARRRLEFDALLLRRVADLRDEPDAGDPDLLDAHARAFADAVDRENSSRGILRAGVQVDYVDAVVLTGQGGHLVVDAPEYDAAPVYWQARAGDPDSVVRGRDLDGYLRTGEQRYAERLGFA